MITVHLFSLNPLDLCSAVAGPALVFRCWLTGQRIEEGQADELD